MEEMKVSELTEEEVVATETVETEVSETSQEDLRGESLTDRVKVLSPMATVMKRFFRSKLSVVGLIVIFALFLFSFVGPLLSPWYKGGESIIDTTTKYEYQEVPVTYIIEHEDGTTEEIFDGKWE